MSTTVDVLVTEYKLNAHQYTQGAKQVTGATAGLEAGASKAAMAMTAIRASAMAAATAFSAMAAAGLMSFQKFVEFESLQKALESVEGSAESAADAIKALKDIAKAPGLGFQEAVRGYMMLRNQGVSGPGAERMVSEFGNANARAGGGKAELQRILLAVSQIAGQRFLQGDELRQLTEAGIPAARLVRERFGTSDTEQLKRQGVTSEQVLTALLDDLERMPRVAGGAKNSIENLQDALNFAFVTTGAAIASSGLTDFLNEFGNEIQNLSDSGFFDGIVAMFTSIEGPSLSARDAVIGLAAALDVVASVGGSVAQFFTELMDVFGPIVKLAVGSSLLGGMFLEGIEARRTQMEVAAHQSKIAREQSEKRKAAQEGAALMEKPAPEMEAEPKKHTALLNRIAVAEEKQLELQRIMLGASGARNLAFQPVELSGVRRRGGGIESELVRVISEWVDQKTAQQVAAWERAHSPFAVRRG